MVAVMAVDVYPSGLGHDLLCEWAAFARDDREDGSSSWSVKPRVDRGYHGDPPDRWYVVNRIVSRLLKDHDDYRKVVKPFYLGERAPWEIARSLGRSEHGVLVTLLHVCGIVEREFNDMRGMR